MFIKVLGVSYQYWKKYDDSRVLHYPNATDRVSVDPWKLPDTLLTKISHFYISFIYCIESVFIRVWGYGKTYCGINLMIQRDLPEATEMSQADPLMSPHSYLLYDQSITPYILFITMKLFL